MDRISVATLCEPVGWQDRSSCRDLGILGDRIADGIEADSCGTTALLELSVTDELL